MKRTRKMMLVTLMATAAIAMTLMSKAFAAPAGTTTTCPTKSQLMALMNSKGINLPTANSMTATDLQKLLTQYGVKMPSLPANSTCPKAQPALNSVPAVTKPTATPAPAAPKPTATPAPVSNPPATGSMTADEQKMINLVNQDRAANGLAPLTFDSGLRVGALAHSQDMSQNNYFSHTSPTKGEFGTRVRNSGVKYTSAGENIAMYGSVEAAEAGFMNSPGHRANILGNYTRIGIGIVYNASKGSYYITQWFAR